MPLRALSDKFRDPNADYKVCAANGIQVQTVFDGTACFFDGEAPALYCENQMVCEGQDCLDRCISFGGKSLVCYPTAKQAKKEFTKASELTSFCFPVVGPAVGCESIERPQVAALVPSEEKLRDERCVQDDVSFIELLMWISNFAKVRITVRYHGIKRLHAFKLCLGQGSNELGARTRHSDDNYRQDIQN